MSARLPPDLPPPGPAGAAELRALLGPAAASALARLDDSELRDLSAAVADARRRQAQALAAAGERALSLIPRLLRGPVRKIVGA